LKRTRELVREVVVRSELVLRNELDVTAHPDDAGEVPKVEVDGPDVQCAVSVEPVQLPERVEEALA